MTAAQQPRALALQAALLALVAATTAASAHASYYAIEPIVPDSLIDDLHALNEAYFTLHQLHPDTLANYFAGRPACDNERYLHQEVVLDEEARASHLLLHVFQKCAPEETTRLADVAVTLLPTKEVRVEARVLSAQADDKDAGAFYQDFALNDDDDTSTLSASYSEETGHITISVRKTPDIEPRSIEVTVVAAPVLEPAVPKASSGAKSADAGADACTQTGSSADADAKANTANAENANEPQNSDTNAARQRGERKAVRHPAPAAPKKPPHPAGTRRGDPAPEAPTPTPPNTPPSTPPNSPTHALARRHTPPPEPKTATPSGEVRGGQRAGQSGGQGGRKGNRTGREELERRMALLQEELVALRAAL